MPRQFPLELHIGQKVLVRPAPTAHAVEALVTAFDAVKGIVFVQPIGYAIRWMARPRAIESLNGHYLHHKDETFFFDTVPFFA